MFAAIKHFMAGAVAKVSDLLWPNVSLLLRTIGTAGATNSSFRDDGPYNFLPTRNGDVTQGTFSPFGALSGTADATAATTGSVYFDGNSGSYITIPSYGTAIGTNDFTVECWIMTNKETYPTLFDFTNSSSTTTAAITLGVGWVTAKRISVWNAATSSYLMTGTIDINPGSWYHVALTRSGTALKLYVNGVQDGSVTNSTNWSTTNAIVGAYYDNTAANRFLGCISNFRLVVGSSLYSSAFIPPAAPLTAVTGTRVLTCQSATSISDASGNAYSLVRGGTVRASVDTPFGYGSAYFDGTGDYLEPAAATAATNFGTGDFTAEFWYYPIAAGQQNCLDNFGNSGVALYRDSSGYMNYYISGNVIISTTALSNNTWWHVALVRSSGSSKLYINGVKEGSTYTDSTNFAGGAAYPRIGTAFNGAVGVNGYMSNVRIVKNAVYTAAFTPPTAPLTAISGTSLLTAQDKGRIADASSNAFAVTRAGDVKPVGETPFAQKGDGRWSAYIDGSNSGYLSVPMSSGIQAGSGDWTWECWVYPLDSGAQRPVYVDRTGGDFTGLGFYLNSGVFGGVVNNGAGGWGINNISGAGSVAANAWSHLAVSRSGSTWRYFVNGALTNTQTLAGSPTQGGPAMIGYDPGLGASAVFYGYISNVRVVKSAVYTAAFTPSTTPLTAIAGTGLLACQDNRHRDASNTNATITRFGTASVSKSSPFGSSGVVATTNLASAGSVYFDGTGDYLTTSSSAGALGFGTGDYTVEAWVNPDSRGNSQGIITGSSGCFALRFGAAYGTGGALNGLQVTKSLVSDYDYCLYTFTPGQWYHVVVVRQSGVVSFFVNGIKQTTVASNSATNWSNETLINIGIDSDYTTEPYKGFISNVRVVKGTAVYASNFTPSTSPLTAISGTSLLTAQDAVTVTDASSNAFTVTKVGDAKAVEASPFKRVTYPFGGSAYFDGTGDYLTIPKNASHEFGTGDFTVEAWVYPTVSASNLFASTYAGSSSGWWFRLSYGNLECGFGDAAIISVAVSGAYNSWHHVALSRSGTSMKIYLDGVSVGSATNSTSLNSTGSILYIGCLNTSQPFNGYMSNLRIVKGVAVYTANFTPPVEPVKAVGGTTVLLNFDNAGIYDASGGNNLTSIGDAKASKAVVKYGTENTAFDGTGDYLSIPNGSQASLSGNFTVETWFYQNATVFYGNIFGTTSDYVTASSLRISTGPSNNTLQVASAGSVLFNASSTFANSAWIHVALVRSGTTLTLYQNGVSVGSVTNSTSFVANTPYIGNSLGTGSPYCINGFLEDFRITRSARYTANFTPPSEALPTALPTT